MRRTIVLDLDGTLCLGDLPARFVAEHAFELLDVSAAEAARIRYEAYLAGEHQLYPEARDMYHALTAISDEHGISRADLSAAFLAARARYEEWLPGVHAPRRLIEALGRMSDVRRVLVTNSPDTGIERILEGIGVLEVLDEIVTSAGKPDGMPAALDSLGIPGAVAASELAAMGDLWENDLAHVHARGGTTFHISHGGWTDGTPTHRAVHPDEFAAPLLAWHGGM